MQLLYAHEELLILYTNPFPYMQIEPMLSPQACKLKGRFKNLVTGGPFWHLGGKKKNKYEFQDADHIFDNSLWMLYGIPYSFQSCIAAGLQRCLHAAHAEGANLKLFRLQLPPVPLLKAKKSRHQFHHFLICRVNIKYKINPRNYWEEFIQAIFSKSRTC